MSKLSRYLAISLVSLLLTIGFNFYNPYPVDARSWLDLLLQGVQVIQLSSITPRQEVALGQQINQQLVGQGKVRLARDREINAYVNEIGRELARTSARNDIPYTFQVVQDNSVNAFATMGGFVYLHTGLIRLAANEAELASVIAHEIGHIAAKHSITQLRNTALTRGLLSAAGLDTQTWVQLGVSLAYDLPNSRSDELEADRLGFDNLIAAGYAPSAMISFMEKLNRSGRNTPAILSTHPDTGARVTALQQYYNRSGVRGGRGLDADYYRSRIASIR